MPVYAGSYYCPEIRAIQVAASLTAYVSESQRNRRGADGVTWQDYEAEL